MTSEPKISDGLVGSGENLRQNVMLAASGTTAIDTPDTLKSSRIDIALSDSSGDLEKESTKSGFWQNVFHLRENLVKSKNKACVTNLTQKRDEKSLNNSCIIGSITSLSKRSKHQIDGDKSQTKHNDSHNLDDTGDCISELIGHIGLWQVVWVIFLIMFQVPSAFHIFSFMFQVILAILLAFLCIFETVYSKHSLARQNQILVCFERRGWIENEFRNQLERGCFFRCYLRILLLGGTLIWAVISLMCISHYWLSSSVWR